MKGDWGLSLILLHNLRELCSGSLARSIPWEFTRELMGHKQQLRGEIESKATSCSAGCKASYKFVCKETKRYKYYRKLMDWYLLTIPILQEGKGTALLSHSHNPHATRESI